MNDNGRLLVQTLTTAIQNGTINAAEALTAAAQMAQESNFGMGWGQAGAGSNNFGAIIGRGNAGFFTAQDSSPDPLTGAPIVSQRQFAKFATPMDGLKAQLNTILKPAYRAALARNPSLARAAAALYGAGYYEGRTNIPAKAIADYANWLRKAIPALVAAGMSEAGLSDLRATTDQEDATAAWRSLYGDKPIKRFTNFDDMKKPALFETAQRQAKAKPAVSKSSTLGPMHLLPLPQTGGKDVVARITLLPNQTWGGWRRPNIEKGEIGFGAHLPPAWFGPSGRDAKTDSGVLPPLPPLPAWIGESVRPIETPSNPAPIKAAQKATTNAPAPQSPIPPPGLGEDSDEVAETIVSHLKGYANATNRATAQQFATNPIPWLALGCFESGLQIRFERVVAYDATLGRAARRFGIFALHEVWTPWRYKQAARIGSLASALPPFPYQEGGSWTLNDARKALLQWPNQLEIAAIVLDYFLSAMPQLMGVPVELPSDLPADFRIFYWLWAFWEASSVDGAKGYAKAHGTNILNDLRKAWEDAGALSVHLSQDIKAYVP